MTVQVTYVETPVHSYDMRTTAQIASDEAWLNEQFGILTDE